MPPLVNSAKTTGRRAIQIWTMRTRLRFLSAHRRHRLVVVGIRQIAGARHGHIESIAAFRVLRKRVGVVHPRYDAFVGSIGIIRFARMRIREHAVPRDTLKSDFNAATILDGSTRTPMPPAPSTRMLRHLRALVVEVLLVRDVDRSLRCTVRIVLMLGCAVWHAG